MSTTLAASAVPMPRLSDSMEEGTILQWLRQSGEQIARGEELCEIETDKATMVYEADREGELTIVVPAGETVAVGDLIAYIGEVPAGDAPPPAPAADGPSAVAPAPAASGSGPAPAGREQPAAPAPAGGRILASPVARRIAHERGVSLAGRTGSRPGGRIVKADVIAWADEQAPPPAAPAVSTPAPAEAGDQVVELNRVQAIIARRMTETKSTVPDFQVTVAVAMDAAAEMRRTLAATVAEGAPTPSFNDLIVKAAAIALRRHPRVNGAYVDGRFHLHSAVNVAIAVAADDALMTPTITEADRLGLGEIAIRSRRLAGRCRDGTITPPELAGGTFTISNLGMFGVDNFTAIINSPQAAILAVGAIAEEPVAKDGELTVGKVMRMTLSCDHRILYGADAAAFLADLRSLLEDPLRMLL